MAAPMNIAPRKLIYLTGTRADFGLMRNVLCRIDADPRCDLGLAVTGMHLSDLFGRTVTEIRAAGLTIATEIRVPVEDGTAGEATHAVGTVIKSLGAYFETDPPEALMLLGDRSEMLGAAIAALHHNIPIFHIHGGERSGTIDESMRHAISKLSHYHFTSTEAARDRLIAMGEIADHVFVTGAPGLDALQTAENTKDTAELAELGLDSDAPFGLMVFHPVVQSEEQAGAQFETLFQAAIDTGIQWVVLAPNSDSGSQRIRQAQEGIAANPKVHLFPHLERSVFTRLMALSAVMLGNSSSGIIEAASFGTPVVNVGDRQTGRERNCNTADVSLDRATLREAIEAAIAHGRYPTKNIYGDGRAAERISALVRELPLNTELLNKFMTY